MSKPDYQKPKQTAVILSYDALPIDLQLKMMTNNAHVHFVGDFLRKEYTAPLLPPAYYQYSEEVMFFVGHDEKQPILEAIQEDGKDLSMASVTRETADMAMAYVTRLGMLEEILLYGEEISQIPEDHMTLIKYFIKDAEELFAQKKISVFTREIDPDRYSL